ncbi:hypothetical protein GCM10022209_18850 [Chitinophaga oryziterrae]
MAVDVNVSECNLSTTNFFFNTDITGTNFVDAENYLIDPKTNKIKNAKFNLPGALSFLSALDIVIVD